MSVKSITVNSKAVTKTRPQHRINMLVDREFFKLAKIEAVKKDIRIGLIIDEALAARYASQLNQSNQ